MNDTTDYLTPRKNGQLYELVDKNEPKNSTAVTNTENTEYVALKNRKQRRAEKAMQRAATKARKKKRI